MFYGFITEDEEILIIGEDLKEVNFHYSQTKLDSYSEKIGAFSYDPDSSEVTLDFGLFSDVDFQTEEYCKIVISNEAKILLEKKDKTVVRIYYDPIEKFLKNAA